MCDHFLKKAILLLSVTGIVAIGLIGLGCGSETDLEQQPTCLNDQAEGCQNPAGEDPSLVGEDPKLRDPFDPFVMGNNTCYMVQAYFPKDALNDLLPDKLSIPDAATMAQFYPDTAPMPDGHPFLLSFCHGSDIHDVLTGQNVPEQEEIMFLFPVIYTHDNGDEYLCSYVPVLYLDSFLGVIGGLYYGLRKEYHPGMEHEATSTSRSWSVENILSASFETQTEEDLAATLPNFFEQTFTNPFVTVSYPMPFPRMVFYQAKVFPDIVEGAIEDFSWTYKGTTIEDSDNTWSVYAEYEFSMSQPMNAKKYFGK